ncbi:hypothetical protein BC332_15188 [Capsicum chinense]|nr:hypothetical protein BC332_15188 [Capsicum chinense]
MVRCGAIELPFFCNLELWRDTEEIALRHWKKTILNVGLGATRPNCGPLLEFSKCHFLLWHGAPLTNMGPTRVLRDFSTAIFKKYGAKLAHILPKAASSNKIVDIQDIFLKASPDAIFRVAYGVELDNMSSSNKEGTKFSDAFDNANAVLIWRYVDILWRIKRALIKIAQKIKEATTKNETATDVMDFAANVSEDALKKMQYLHATLTETLRIYPDAKICISNNTLPDGFNVNKGDMVSYQPYAIERMKFIWGDDVEEYKSKRWLDEDGFFRPKIPSKFTALQAGLRICLGKEFAYR